MLTDKNELLGKTLGTCVLERLIDQGGMGAVYVARQQRPRRSVAVKVFLPGPTLDDKARADFLARFRREADAIASLDHIHIIPVYEYGEQDQQAYLVMPYISGGTLRQILSRRGSLPLNEALPLIEQIAEALDYAHELGIIHRDIKPGNILFHADGRLLLADFGLAKILSEAQTTITRYDDSSSTSHGAMIGTPEYISPEQALGRPIDRRTDVYSLGVVLFQMLTGQVPFVGNSPVATAVMHAQSEPPSPSAIMPTITPEVESVILRAIEKVPAQRYPTAGAFASALRSVAERSQLTGSASLSGQRKSASRPPHILLNNDTEPEIEMVVATSEAAPIGQHVSEPKETTPTWQHIAEAKTATPLPSFPERPEKTRRKQRLPLFIFSLLLILLLGGSGLLAWTHIPQFHPAPVPTPTFPGETPQPTHLAQPAVTPTSPAATTPLIKVGQLLYQNAALYPTCSGDTNSWNLDTNAQVVCKDNGTVLHNTTGIRYLATMFLNSINGYGIPNDYVLQVKATPQPGSQEAFGVLFRNQPDQGNLRHNGAYTLMLDPLEQSWTISIYDDKTGHATTLGTGSIPIPPYNKFTIDLAIHADVFTFFLNGQELGAVTDSTYPSGTLGFTVKPDTTVLFQNLAIYEQSPD